MLATAAAAKLQTDENVHVSKANASITEPTDHESFSVGIFNWCHWSNKKESNSQKNYIWIKEKQYAAICIKENPLWEAFFVFF